MERTAKQINTKDLTEGALFSKILLFTLPIIFTGILQLLFNTADIIVVGNFASPTALSAVGSTGAIINLTVNFLIGLSAGAGVLVANCFGSKDDKGIEETVHTAMLTALIGGVVFGAIGWFFSKYFLIWMGTPDDVIEQATLYTRIYFLGIPFSIVYNFGASVLRAVGDTKRPLYFLIAAGVINVIFNLFFVIVLKMDVAGVATATVISQVVSCVLVVRYLIRVDGCHKLTVKNLRIVKNRLIAILLIGFPAGIQGSLFSISNMLIQSGINKFGSTVMAGSAAAGNIEGFIYIAMNAFHHTAISFVGQNMGAGKHDRVKKTAFYCLASVSVIGVVFGVLARLLGKYLIGIYVSGDAEYESEVIRYGLLRMNYIAFPYFICGIMDVMSGILRGMKRSFTAMLITLACVCGFRVIWIYTAFRAITTFEVLFLSYPISWLICIAGQAIALAIAIKKTETSGL